MLTDGKGQEDLKSWVHVLWNAGEWWLLSMRRNKTWTGLTLGFMGRGKWIMILSQSEQKKEEWKELHFKYTFCWMETFFIFYLSTLLTTFFPTVWENPDILSSCSSVWPILSEIEQLQTNDYYYSPHQCSSPQMLSSGNKDHLSKMLSNLNLRCVSSGGKAVWYSAPELTNSLQSILHAQCWLQADPNSNPSPMNLYEFHCSYSKLKT